MLHAFKYMGIPKTVLTDNMKSVVIKRDSDGRPIWNHDYEVFMKVVGFETRLCKPYHPFTKGKVERLVQFVKGHFLAGRTFMNVTDLNEQALNWCNGQNSAYHKAPLSFDDGPNFWRGVNQNREPRKSFSCLCSGCVTPIGTADFFLTRN